MRIGRLEIGYSKLLGPTLLIRWWYKTDLKVRKLDEARMERRPASPPSLDTIA